MKKVVLGIALLNQLVSGMDLPSSSSGEQERRSNLRETTIEQLSINDLQDMIRDSVKMAVITNTREFREAVNEVSSQLKEALNQRINFQAMNFQTVLERKEEEHKREMEAINAQLEEARNEKIQVEREKELHKRISRVFIANPALRSEKIMIKSNEIMRINDASERHNTTKRYYDKFVLFSELFSNENELSQLRSYVNQSQNLLNQLEYIMNWDKNVHWGDRFDAWGDVKEFAISKGFTTDPWWDAWRTPNVNFYYHHKGHQIEAAFRKENERRQKHNDEIREQILNMSFPSESFDRLVEQFNTFISKL